VAALAQRHEDSAKNAQAPLVERAVELRSITRPVAGRELGATALLLLKDLRQPMMKAIQPPRHRHATDRLQLLSIKLVEILGNGGRREWA
jgi:hypothetical protein